MKAKIDQRLAELRDEYERGSELVAQQEVELNELRGQLLRISGAIRALEELRDDT